MLEHFEKGERCDSNKIWASFHTTPAEFENDTKCNGNLLRAVSPGIWCQRNVPTP